MRTVAVLLTAALANCAAAPVKKPQANPKAISNIKYVTKHGLLVSCDVDSKCPTKEIVEKATWLFGEHYGMTGKLMILSLEGATLRIHPAPFKCSPSHEKGVTVCNGLSTPVLKKMSIAHDACFANTSFVHEMLHVVDYHIYLRNSQHKDKDMFVRACTDDKSLVGMDQMKCVANTAEFVLKHIMRGIICEGEDG
jgi:uncharacterized protein (DUF1697 family)